MASAKKTPKSLAEQWMPDLDPAIRDQWVKSYAAPAMAVTDPSTNPFAAGFGAPGESSQFATNPNTAEIPYGVRAPSPVKAPADSMTSALRAANRTPGSAAPPPPASPSLFDMKLAPRVEDADGVPEETTAPAGARAPKGGDWKGRDKWVAGEDAKERKANLEGATFATPPSGPAPGTMISPGGRTPHSWTTQTQEGTKLSPDTIEKTEKAEQSKQDAARWDERAASTAADRELDILNRHENVQQIHQQELRARAEDQRYRYEDELGKLNTITDAVRSDKIDPQAWFTKRGTAGMFATGIGALLTAGLGGLGAGMQGHGAQNQGLAAINNSIQQEIDSQKANAALNRGKLEDQRSLLGQMSRTFGDERVGEEAAWIAYLERAKTQLAAGAAQAKSDFAKAKYRDAMAGIDEQIAGRREKWDQLTQDRVTRVQHDVNAPAQYAGAGQPLDKHTREEATGIAKELTERGIPQARAQLGDIERSIDTLGTGDIPGVGPLASHVPDILAKQVFGDRAIAGRQAVATIKNATRKSIAGASLTEGEKVELDKQLEGAHDAASLRRVVHSFRESLAAQEQTIRAMGSDQASAEVARRQEANKKFAVPVDKPSTPYLKPIE